MYTILVNDDNTLTTSVKERIMQRSKLVDTLHFLINQTYKDYDMSDFTVNMEYILPVSKEYRSEILEKEENLYKDKLEYKLPFDTNWTKEHGNIEVQLTFIKTELDEEGVGKQFVRKTSPTTITIVPISAWSDIIPDKALNAIDQKLIQVDTMIKTLTENIEINSLSKADNIKIGTLDDSNKSYLYLTSEGKQIGDPIDLDEFGNSLSEDDTEGLIKEVHYYNGKIKRTC